MSSLVFRADASGEIGTGHVMRCLALAQAWRDRGGRAFFVSAATLSGVEERLKEEGMKTAALSSARGSHQDAEETAAFARRNGADWVVVDGYHFDGDYQGAAAKAGVKVLFVDDYGHAGSYPADIVLNQNSYAAESFYSRRGPHSRLLLGTNYALIRREFSEGPKAKAAPERARKVLVTLGGGDIDQSVMKVLEAASTADSPELEIVVAAGANSDAGALASAVRGAGRSLRVEKNSRRMRELMDWADMAVAAGGTTCWELCRMSVPFVVTILAENQRRIAEDLDRRGAAASAGELGRVPTEKLGAIFSSLAASAPRRAEMSRRGSELVDGKGCARVIAAMEESGK